MQLRPFSIFRNAVAVLLLGFVASASANTTVNVSATKDAMIFGTSGDADTGNASGKGPAMFAGADGQSNKKRSLVTFDLASAGIPSNATIVSVVMTLYIGQIAGSGGGGAPGSYPSRTIRVYHVNNTWGEGPSGSPTNPNVGGTGQGYAIQTGDSSWTYRFYSGTSWSTLGADFVATPIASSTFTAPFALFQPLTWSSAGMVADVQSWLSTPSSHNGWLIKSDLETSPTSFLGFWTKDGAAANSNPAIAPKLEITYSVP